MARRLNYGTKYSNGNVDGKYRYDEKLADDMYTDTMRMLNFLRNTPQYKKELHGYMAAKKRTKIVAKRQGTEPQDREEAEKRMAEAVAKVVEILEFHMDDMIQYRRFANHTQHVNQIGIHNAIVQLRTKCGVKFSGNNSVYDHVTHHTPEQRTEEQKIEDFRSEMEQQRLARIRHNKEIAARLIARVKSG